MNVSVVSLNRYGSRNWTLARGAPLPGSVQSKSVTRRLLETDQNAESLLTMDDLLDHTADVTRALSII
jgi:hypothetical protein